MHFDRSYNALHYDTIKLECLHLYCIFSGRNKGQNLIGHFLKMHSTFCRLLIATPLKMYNNLGPLK